MSIVKFLIIYFASRWPWLYERKEDKDVAVGRREERATVCSNKQTDDNCRVCCGMVILKPNYNSCFKSKFIGHIHKLITPDNGYKGPGVNLSKLLQL